MRWKPALVIWCSLLCGSCASHAGQQVSELPTVLHGVWRTHVDSCKAAEEIDGDGWVEIRANNVHGYERNSRVLSISSISDTPQAWKVRLRHDDQGDISEGDAIFVATSEDQSRLVVIDASTYQAYIRCEYAAKHSKDVDMQDEEGIAGMPGDPEGTHRAEQSLQRLASLEQASPQRLTAEQLGQSQPQQAPQRTIG